jgi:hypothetical protein
MHAEAYRAENTIWVDYIADPQSIRRTVIRFAAFAFVPWAIGFLVSFLAGATILYLSTPYFYIGSFGVFFTAGAIYYGSRRQYAMYDRVIRCFELDETQRRESVLNALERHSNLYNHMRATSIIFFLGVLVAAAGFLWWPKIFWLSDLLNMHFPRFRSLESYGWYDDSLKYYSLFISLVFLLFIAPTLGTAASNILRLPLFLLSISKAVPKVPPALVKLHFTSAAHFYTVISFLWLFGVFLLYLFFSPNEDWPGFFLVGLTLLFGLFNFSVPQIAYIRTISRSEDLYLNLVADNFADRKNNALSQRLQYPSSYGFPADRTNDMLLLIHLLKHDQWVYPLHQTYFIVVAYMVSLSGWIFDWSMVLRAES